MPLSVAVVGITHWHAERYVQVLRQRAARLTGASDADPAAGARAAERYGIPFIADTSDMLGKAKADFALVLPRHDRAPAEAAAVVDRRLPMMIEKPMGRNGAEARKTADIVRKSRLFATVAFPNRHLEFWNVYDDLKAKGELGTPIHAHFRTVNGPPSRYVGYGVPWMLDPAISGGGCLRNLGIHGADAVRHLAGGRKLALVGGTVTNIGHKGPLEDFAAGTFRTEDGFVATVESGYSYASMQEGGDYEWRIASTGVYLKDTGGTLTVRLANGQLSQRPSWSGGNAYEIVTNKALDAFESGRPPIATVDECAEAVALQDLIYAAAQAARSP
jgi:predicted dehydrogenase